MQKIIATKKERLDKFLVENLEETRTKIQALIKEEKILVNQNKVKSNYIVKENDEIEILDFKKEENIIQKEEMDLNIIYEDDDVIVINKKSGIVVHPAPGNYTNTLVNGLMSHTSSLSDNDLRPGIVHRIDKDTSGLLIVAKNDKAHVFLANELKEHNVKRVYIALVEGVINHDSGTIDAPIGRDVKDRKKMSVTSIHSKLAKTQFKVLKRFNNATLVECSLETGRTHQIRVHFKYINHPIVNDRTYNSKNVLNNYGQLLHAKKISFIHPTTKTEMTFECEIPIEFTELMEEYVK